MNVARPRRWKVCRRVVVVIVCEMILIVHTVQSFLLGFPKLLPFIILDHNKTGERCDKAIVERQL